MNIPDICPIFRVTHFPCPTCGITRAFVALAGGDVVGALGFHPLFWLVPFAVAAVVYYMRRKTKLGLWLMLSACAAFALCWIARVTIFGWRG
jgi:Protein of unknown function (DUF2752).